MAPNANPKETADIPAQLPYALNEKLEWETQFLFRHYGTQVRNFDVKEDGAAELDVAIDNPNDPGTTVAFLMFSLPSEYPKIPPKYQIIPSMYLTPREEGDLDLLLQLVLDRHTGSEAIHALIESAKQFMLNGRFGYEGRRAKNFKARNHETVPSESPAILTGPCLTDRSSSFQGHVAKVGSLQNVNEVMDVIKHTRKIKRAKHNCHAFR